MDRVPLFISYSKDDKDWLVLMSTHLSPLRVNGLIEPWDDRQLGGGDRLGWEEKLMSKLSEAGVIVLLYSASFAATDYCQKELKIALARKRKGEAKVWVVRVRPCELQSDAEFFQVRPAKGGAISTAPSPDQAMQEVAAEIRKALEKGPAAKGAALSHESLPYLYNRSDQEEAIQKLIEDNTARAKRPLVLLWSGAEREEHTQFHERLSSETLPPLLKLTANQYPRPMTWPTEAGEAGLKVRRALELTAGNKHDAIIRGLPKGITYLFSNLYNDWDAARQLAIVKEFLNFWSGFPDLPATKAVCASVAIVWKRKGPSRLELESLFPHVDYPKLRFRVLPDLAPVDASAADVWVGHRKVRESYNTARHGILLREIRTLFATRKTIPMRDLHQKLLEKLQNCA